ncbi:MAG: protein kinase domain-containing protein [Hyalangium sp.]
MLGRAESQGVLYVLSDVTAAMMRGGCLSAGLALYVGAEAASALHHAHTRTDERGHSLGIIHRDVNPARIYLRWDGSVRLTDFALSRSLLPGRVATSLPRPQGDAYYGSPEALLGEPMDARSDLSALGLVMRMYKDVGGPTAQDSKTPAAARSRSPTARRRKRPPLPRHIQSRESRLPATIGQGARLARARAGLTQAEVAEALGSEGRGCGPAVLGAFKSPSAGVCGAGRRHADDRA